MSLTKETARPSSRGGLEDAFADPAAAQTLPFDAELMAFVRQAMAKLKAE